MTEAQEIAIPVADGEGVSGLLVKRRGATACIVLAHGAGAGMRHAFMEAIAAALADRKVASLRYQFPYMERGSRRPDAPKVTHEAVRAAVAAAARRTGDMPLFAGGKSFGGRMTSQAQALEPLEGVRGLVFLGFPLHPPGKPGTERGDHLFDVRVPMLFLQGTRDEFGGHELIEPLVGRLGALATLEPVEGANHSYRVPKAAGLSPAKVIDDLAARAAAWIKRVA